MTIFWNKVLLKSKKQYILLGALALLGILLLFIGSQNDAGNAAKMAPSVVEQVQVYDTVQRNDIMVMEHRLADTLAQIKDAGNVTVQIRVKNNGRKEYAVDTQRTSRTTIEESADTSKHTTELQEQYTVVQQNRSGTQDALLIEETAPEITGVLVVASGANDALVQERLLHAVKALLQLPLHQIVVMPGEENCEWTE